MPRAARHLKSPGSDVSATNSVKAIWAGGLRCHVITRTTELVVDASKNTEGAGGPSPTDYLLVSLASCYAAALAWEARKRQIELSDLSVTATGTYEGLRFSHLLLSVTTSLPRDRLDQLLGPALRICYVSNTISASAVINVTVR